MQTIIHIKDGLWSNLAMIAFCLVLVAGAVAADLYSNGTVSFVVWIFATFFVLFCWVPISAILRPKSLLLAVDGYDLLWRIYNGKTREMILEKRLVLSSIRGLKWIVHHGDYANARLLFITDERASHTLPDEFFAAHHRKKIERALKERIPDLKIVEKIESIKESGVGLTG